ncbi:MAG: hypothetical protein V7760_04270 [Marinobacter sp.]
MFLAEKSTGHMIDVLDTKALFDSNESTVKGSLHFGEEAQDLGPTKPFPDVADCSPCLRE